MTKIPDKARQIMSILLNPWMAPSGRMMDPAKDVLIVGGFVRDSLLGVENKDVDIEVYGMDIDSIKFALLANGFKVNSVGKAFGVLKIDNELDISVPRRENKIGVGHKGFDVVPDPNMSVKEAASRRDFTINSMAMNIHGLIIDPFNGKEDLENGILRATSGAFKEDPLRVMRAMQFAARFGFVVEAWTRSMCRDMQWAKNQLPKERMWEEWKKWALKGQCPGHGLKVLADMFWADQEIDMLKDVPQDPEWHPEGDVFVHTCLVVNAAAKVADREQLGDHDRLVLMFAALCHDFGKPETTAMIDGRWRARGHCEAGVEPARRFLERIGAPAAVILEVLPLISDHLVHAGVKDPSDKAIRRLANRIAPATIEALGRVVEADHSGRLPLPVGNPLSVWVERAASLNVCDSKPEAILKGRHLIEMGIQPGKQMGDVLKRAFEAQLDGVFDDVESAKKWCENES